MSPTWSFLTVPKNCHQHTYQYHTAKSPLGFYSTNQPSSSLLSQFFFSSSPQPPASSFSNVVLYISSGLSFDDGYQILVSAQKPLGMVLEESENGVGCVVAEIDVTGSAYQGGVRVGDWLVAVQNADVSLYSIEQVLDRIIKAPRVVNLRFQRSDGMI